MTYISKSMYKQFQKEFADGKYAGLRYGQAFYSYFKLHRTVDNMNHIYNADDDRSMQLIAAMIDHEQ